MARKIAWLIAILTMAASGTYVFVYLYRWEWNRALTAAAIFIATEVAVFGVLILDRLHRAADAGPRTGRSSGRAPLAPAVDDTPPRDHFAWLAESTSRLSVFIPVLLGAGILLSGLAWLVERLARAAARPGLEWRMPDQFEALALPREQLVGSTELPMSDARARLLAPGRGES